jgi:hypothetical protein
VERRGTDVRRCLGQGWLIVPDWGNSYNRWVICQPGQRVGFHLSEYGIQYQLHLTQQPDIWLIEYPFQESLLLSLGLILVDQDGPWLLISQADLGRCLESDYDLLATFGVAEAWV